MLKRRGFVLTLTSVLVSLSFVVGTVLADELLGVLIKVDIDDKVITVVEKDTDKEIKVKVDDDTEVVTPKGTRKIDLEKLAKGVEKAKEKGRKGTSVKVTHKKGVASKIEYTKKKDSGKNAA
jgi:hypothetical protein